MARRSAASAALRWPLMAQGDAEVVLDFRVVRVKLRGAGQGVQRVVIFLLAELEVAEGGQVVGVVGALHERGADVLVRVVQLALLQLDGGEVGERDAVVLVAVEDFQVVRLGRVELLRGKMRLRGGDQFGGAGGHLGNGFLFAVGIGRRRHDGIEQGHLLGRVGRGRRLIRSQPGTQDGHLGVQRGKLGGIVNGFAAGIGRRQRRLEPVLQRHFFQRGNFRLGLAAWR